MGKTLFHEVKLEKWYSFLSRCKTETEVAGWGGSGYFSYPLNGQTLLFAVVFINTQTYSNTKEDKTIAYLWLASNLLSLDKS